MPQHRVVVQFPLKWLPSERIPGKNFRPLNGRPMFAWVLERMLVELPETWDLWLDSESEQTLGIVERAGLKRFDRLRFHERHPIFAENWANGNHLIHQFAVHRPDYDYFVQCFTTSVTQTAGTLIRAMEQLIGRQPAVDSVLSVAHSGQFIWRDGEPVTHDARRPDGFCRTQDMKTLRETCAFYGVTRAVALGMGTRVGRTPLLFEVPANEAIDIDYQRDWDEAAACLPKK